MGNERPKKAGIKKSKVLIAGAGVAVAIGMFLIVASIPASSDTTTVTIPAGLFYYLLETRTLLNGEVSGSFNVVSGDNVTLLIFDEVEFSSYEETGLATPIFAVSDNVSGESRPFSVSQDGLGKLFLVFEHEELNGGETDVEVNIRISGIAVVFFVIGAVLVAVGAVLAIIGTRLRKNETAEEMAKYGVVVSPPLEGPKT